MMKYKLYNGLVAASINYGEKAAKWGLEQAFWVCLLVGGIGLVVSIVKKAWVGAGASLLITAIVCYFLKNPTKISDIGSGLAEMLGI